MHVFFRIPSACIRSTGLIFLKPRAAKIPQRNTSADQLTPRGALKISWHFRGSHLSCLLFLLSLMFFYNQAIAMEVKPKLSWIDHCNALGGEYQTAQGVCDARQALLGSNTATFYVEFNNAIGAVIGGCFSKFNPNATGVNVWCYPVQAYYCPKNFKPSPHPVMVNCGNYLDPTHFHFKETGVSCVRISDKPDPGKEKGTSCSAIGNPINPGTGNKYQIEKHYVGYGTFPLRIENAYNSESDHALTTDALALGSNWQSSYARNISLNFDSTNNSGTASATRPDGKIYYFNLNSNGYWVSEADITDKLIGLKDADGSFIGWAYTVEAIGEIETYDANGKLLSITNHAGLTQSLTYDASGRLQSVTDSFGRQLGFSYDAQNRFASMTDPAGGIYAYTYGANNNLISVTYPDGKTESPRVLRRLQILREWSHEQNNQIFPRSKSTRSPYGAGTPR